MNRQSSPCIFSVSPGWSHANSFDEIGNRKTATLNGRVSTYTPNPLNQIDSRTIPRAFDVIGKANSTATVTVDGNTATRLDEYFYKELTAGTGAVHVLYTVAATDPNGTTSRDGGKFLPATPETFIHDFDGNLTSDGRFAYTWDAENRLITMETHSTIPLPARRKLIFAYDFMGRRIKKDVWHGTTGGGWQLHHKFDFIHELGGWNILAERSGGSKDTFLRTYTWGTDLSGNLTGAGGVGGLLFSKLHTSSKTLAYGLDLNGNVTLLVDTATGQSAATYDYGPFGELLRQSGEYAMLNPFRFSTKYTDDETGVVDYGHRSYLPSIGRWLSKDPIGERGGTNLYGMVKNSPLDNIDPTGLSVFLFTEEGGTSPFVMADLNKIIDDKRKEVKAALNKAKSEGKINELSFAWFDHNGKEEKLGKGEDASAEFIKRMDREKFIEVEVKGRSLRGDLQKIIDAKDDIKYPYDVVVYSKHGNIVGDSGVSYKDGTSFKINEIALNFESVVQALPVQKGGCHFKEVNFLHQDGTVGKPFGKSYTLPLSDNETQTFVFVKGDQLIDPTYKKVATICTDLKKEIVSLDLIARTSAVRRFSGVVYAELKIFNVSKSRFETYQLESNFEAERLPTGNMMNFSMKGITLKELKELTNQ